MEQFCEDLNDVIEYLYDSHNGYKEASDDVENAEMKSYFEKAASTRLRMIDELKAEVRAAGEEPKDSGSISGMAHRMFVNLKSMLTNMVNGNDVKSVVEEVKRGESFTLDKYKEVLQHDLPVNIKTLFERQMNEIQSEVSGISFAATN